MRSRALRRPSRLPRRPPMRMPNPRPPFDPATLPPIDSIVADTDIRAFLQKGVPAELTKAALRRAWSADPAIRDFIDLVENQWDFNDPTAMAGFGPLEAGSDLRKLVAQAMGELPEAAEPAERPEEEAREIASSVSPSEAPAPPAPEPREESPEARRSTGHRGCCIAASRAGA